MRMPFGVVGRAFSEEALEAKRPIRLIKCFCVPCREGRPQGPCLGYEQSHVDEQMQP